ncbi:hypothetical protein BB561_003777 [Smittium simulii]|uniref:Succinate--CoA ligase [ADP-forming] subunit beta, mitochondrial n=1 Tax=Smittium simulii TaxID=133385 RepID=A0A2T9YJJ7_9FUNG|nr:hypothetical protein BB561_003777 [Smittium simulii]
MFRALSTRFPRSSLKYFKAPLRSFSIHEHSSAELFEKNGIAVPHGIVATTPEQAFQAAQSIGGEVVVKAQVLAGGRGKGHFKNNFQGGVHVAKTPEEARDLASKMINQVLVTKQTGEEGKPCNKVFVVEKESVKHEYYFAILMDRASNGPAIIACSSGGMDIEGVAARDPSAIIKLPVNINTGLSKADAEALAIKLGFQESNVPQAVTLMTKLYELFIKTDATQIEINPLAETTDGKVFCMDAKLNLDDNAAYRQQELYSLVDESQVNPKELEAKKWGLNYVGLSGDIGCIVNGAGLAMSTMDIINLYGGSPANFMDLGGGATEESIFQAIRLVVSDPNVNSILVNIFGGIIRCDMVAQAIVDAAKKLEIKIPIVVRLRGTNVEKGQEILKNSGISTYPAYDIGTAVSKVVALNAEYKKSH